MGFLQRLQHNRWTSRRWGSTCDRSTAGDQGEGEGSEGTDEEEASPRERGGKEGLMNMKISYEITPLFSALYTHV